MRIYRIIIILLFFFGLSPMIGLYFNQSNKRGKHMAKRDDQFPWIASNIDRIAGTLKEPNKPTPASQEGTHPLNETRPSKETRPQVATQTQSLEDCPTKDIPGLIGRLKMDMRELTQSESEDIALKDYRQQTISRLKDANKCLQIRLASHRQGESGQISVSDSTVRSAIKEQDIVCTGEGNNYDKVLQNWAVTTDTHILLPGGHWRPKDCKPAWKVAIIIPFRDRSQHLHILLRYLTPILRRQRLEFGFFVVEQGNQALFNRAMLLNVGFVESLKFADWDCFMLHDVDHVPVNDYNYYGCEDMPKLMLTGVNRWGYKMPFDKFFGAVSGLTRDQIKDINGFPNVYWGWGGEDDEIRARLVKKGYTVFWPKGKLGLYDVIKQHHQSAPKMKERFDLLKNFRDRVDLDGLSNLEYPSPSITLYPLYTNITVDIQKLLATWTAHNSTTA